MEIITNSYQETIEFGTKLAQDLQGGQILLLSGNLGAGKTALVKGIAKGLGIQHEITSPTFTLMNIYAVSHKPLAISQLVHIDTYRLTEARELVEIGVEDYLGKPDTVCIIEWPEKINSLLEHTDKTKVISITIEQLLEANQRKISIS